MQMTRGQIHQLGQLTQSQFGSRVRRVLTIPASDSNSPFKTIRFTSWFQIGIQFVWIL